MHLPDLDTCDGVLDLMTVCILTEMANVLNMKTYTEEKMSHAGRVECRAARAKTRHLMEWFFCTYELIDEETQQTLDARDDVYWAYMARVAKCVDDSMDAAPEGWHNGVKFCTRDAVKKQMKDCFANQERYARAARRLKSKVVDSLAWPKDQRFRVVKVADPADPGKSPCLTLQRYKTYTSEVDIGTLNGDTQDDINYRMKGLKRET